MELQIHVRYLNQRPIDAVHLILLSSRDMYTIVQAKSANEPCTRLPGGLYADPIRPSDEDLKSIPENEEPWNVGYGWYIPYNATESSTCEPLQLTFTR